jgi:hypothetical protein
VSMIVDLEPGEDVRTPDKRSLRDAEWTLSLLEAESYNESAAAEGAIGYLAHFEEHSSVDDYSPEACHISVAVKRALFEPLLAALQMGRVPDWASIRVKGMTYGWEPDGSGKEWDVREAKHVPVLELSLRLPVAAAPTLPTTSSGDEPIEPIALPVTGADLKQTQAALISAVQERLGQTQRSMKTLIALVFVLLLVLLFK